MRVIEGIVRGSAGSTFGNPDARFDNIESRLSPAFLAGVLSAPSQSVATYAPAASTDAGATSDNSGKRIPIPRAGTIRNLYARVDVAPGASKSWTVTVRKNGSDQALTAAISGSSAVDVSDIVNSFSVVAGDAISVKVTPAGTPAAAKLSWAMEFVTADVADGGNLDTFLSRGDY